MRNARAGQRDWAMLDRWLYDADRGENSGSLQLLPGRVCTIYDVRFVHAVTCENVANGLTRCGWYSGVPKLR